MSAVIINIDTALTNVPTIEVGKQGENGATQVVFDVSEMIETYGSGTAYVVVQRRGDAEPYLLDNTSQSGDTVTWTVSNVDTDVYGTGRVQLFWMINEQVAKTVTYQFYVEEALHDPQDAPVVPGGWISDEIGNLDNLTTTAKANLVAAINEVNSKATTNTTAIGTLANLTTTEKSNLVGAVNEVNEDVSDVKEDLENLSGLSDEAKEALLACFRHTAFLDDDDDYYQNLYDALYPPSSLTSITAVYTQSGTVLTSDTLNSLKTDLVVTAHYDNASDETVTSYNLSGTLEIGTSTITVSYGGKTTTFTVTVSLPTEIYALSDTTFNGTSDYEDTDIKLLENDTSFSIFIDFTAGTYSSDSALLHCINESSPWPGFFLGERTLNSAEKFRHAYYASGNNTYFSAFNTNRHKYLITHVAGEKGLATWYFDSTTGSTQFGNASLTYTSVNKNLLIGCYQDTSGNKGRYWNGTVHDCKVWDVVLTEKDIEYLMGGSE